MSSGGQQPDWEGFAEMQATLMQQFGRDVRFYGPAAMIYDPSIPQSEFDDEGIPLDPLAGASAVASANVAIANLTLVGSAHCNVVWNPLQSSLLRRDQTMETALAIRSGLNRDLILDPADADVVTPAEYFEVGTFARDGDGNILYNQDGTEQEWTSDDGELWKIVNAKMDSFGQVKRFIVYGEDTR